MLTNTVITNITVGLSPAGVAFDPSNGYVYVVNSYPGDASGSVSVINGTTNKVIANITVGSNPDGVAVDSSNGCLYVANQYSSTVSVINVATNTVIDTVSVGPNPNSAAFDPSNGYVYVTNEFSNNVSIINPTTNTVIDTISVGLNPLGMAVDPSNGYVYVVNLISGSVSILSTSTQYSAKFTESGLPSGVEWYVNGTGVSEHGMSPANITFNLANGTYSFTATNLSSYYTITVHFAVVVSGKNVTETVHYYHWAYIAGKVSPTNATVTINGKAISLTLSGSFNVSVANGTYNVVASSPGYTSYYNNFTLNSRNIKNITINLKPISKPSTLSSTELYAIIGVVVAIVAIVGVIFATMRR